MDLSSPEARLRSMGGTTFHNGGAPTDAPNAGMAPVFYDPWSETPAIEFPSGVLPRPLEETIIALALRDGIDAGALLMTYVTAASGAAPKDTRFFPFEHRDFSVPPIIWMMNVNESGAMKSPMVSLCFSPLMNRHRDLFREFASLKRAFKKAGGGTSSQEEPERPHSFVVGDTTVEALQDILATTTRGTLLLRDELAGMLGFGRYNQTAAAAERAFYLEAYNGTSYPIDRKAKGRSAFVENAALTIFGGIQADRLADFPGLEKDGLIQRFVIIRGAPGAKGRPDIQVRGKDLMDTAILRLCDMQASEFVTDAAGTAYIRRTWDEGLAYATVTDFGVGFRGFCRKLHGTQARLALILHLLDGAANKRDPGRIIPVETVQRAGTLTHEFILPHARDFHAALPGAAHNVMHDVASWILVKNPARIRASDLPAGVYQCRGMGLRQIQELLDPLVTGGWMEPETNFPSNNAWRVHPLLRAAFVEREIRERARREENRRLVAQIGKKR